MRTWKSLKQEAARASRDFDFSPNPFIRGGEAMRKTMEKPDAKLSGEKKEKFLKIPISIPPIWKGKRETKPWKCRRSAPSFSTPENSVFERKNPGRTDRFSLFPIGDLWKSRTVEMSLEKERKEEILLGKSFLLGKTPLVVFPSGLRPSPLSGANRR